jgi:hypothetical protein
MPPKKKDLAAQKAARDKKILMALVPVFIIIFVVMVLPKLTGGSSSPPPAAAAGTDTTTGVGTPVAATTPGATTPVGPPASSSSSAIVAPAYSFSSDDGAHLQRFSGKLKTKDPFAGATEVTVPIATVPLVAPKPPKVDPNATPSTSGKGTGTPGTTTPQKKPYIYAVLSVNGISEGVALHAAFPAASPMFTLTEVGSNWIKFSLLAGAFATGAKAVTVSKGKPLTLRNTADGSRFSIRLVTVSQTVPTATPGTGTTTVTTTPGDTSSTPPPPTTPSS